MPQDSAYEELEKDITESHGGGRCWQEMAKSDYSGAFRPPRSLHRNQILQKEKKTVAVTGRERTQVLKKDADEGGRQERE